MNFSRTAMAIVAAAALGGCAEDAGEKETLGTLLGAIGGAAIGSQIGHGDGRTAAIAAGTLLGALAGGGAGRSLDRADRLAQADAARRARQAPLGQTVTWNNPDSGHRGTVTAVRDGTSAGGLYCREFRQNVTIGGKTEEAYGTACRQPDGTWKLMDTPGRS